MKITRWNDGAVLYEDDALTVRATLEAAVKAKADLQGAYLQGANFQGAYLYGAYLQDAYLRVADLQAANLRGADLQRADLQDAYLRGANLQAANLRGANLQRADLQRADLQRADLRGAYLQAAKLRGADLQGATMPGLPNRPAPSTLAEAAQRTAEWLSEGRWLQRLWIETPTGAYAGDCKACLHGAAVYVGGEFGPELSRKLIDAGYTVEWNDAPGRTAEDVIEALRAVAA